MKKSNGTAKTQVVVMHGGDYRVPEKQFIANLKKEEVNADVFKVPTGWKLTFQKELGDAFEVFNPRMPNKEGATYDEWKTWFERMIPFLNDDVILVGHSLGAIFFARYLAENTFSKKIAALFLVAGPFWDNEWKKQQKEEYAGGGFILPPDSSLITRQVKKVFIYQSEDDAVVPAEDARKFKKVLPEAKLVMFNDKGHFGLETFPELAETIRNVQS